LLCSLPTELSPGLQLGGLTFVQGESNSNKLTKNPEVYSVSHFNLGAWSFVLGLNPPTTQSRRHGELMEA